MKICTCLYKLHIALNIYIKVKKMILYDMKCQPFFSDLSLCFLLSSILYPLHSYLASDLAPVTLFFLGLQLNQMCYKLHIFLNIIINKHIYRKSCNMLKNVK